MVAQCQRQQRPQVWINGQQKIIDIKYATGGDCIEFIVPADGSQHNKVNAQFVGEGTCNDIKEYNAPPACIPAYCDLDITSVSVGECYFDHNDYKSKAKLTVCVSWKNRPRNQLLFVSIDGQSQVIYTSPTEPNGSKCIEFTVLADGSSNNGIWASFPYGYNCRADAKYKAPQPCYQAPPCDLDITNVGVSDCYYDPYDGKSKARLNICVNWNNRPAGQPITVSITGQSQIIYPTSANGTQCVEFTIPANGSYNNGVWAQFGGNANYACRDDAKYNSPQPCLPSCSINITSVTVGDCYYDSYSGTSKAKLTICVKWENRPANENIMVSINGQTISFTPGTSSGTKCVEFIIAANGTTYNGIWAKFQYSNYCQAESKYHAPQPCYQAPQCDLNITSVSVGECYFDHADYNSKAKLKVCLEWKNRPANENIMVSINGQTKTIATTTSNGSTCIEFIIPANGVHNQGIWAKFQYSSDCRDDAYYNAPYPCYETPQCDLDIYSVSVGDCYFDHADYTSKAKLTVCVKWQNRPNNENIVVSINGQSKIIYPNASSGSQCVDFIVTANGAYNNGVWAKFQYNSDCRDDAYYNLPQACYEAPACDLTITSVTAGTCYYDHADYTSKAKLTICVQWKNRPGSENIMVSINGQTKTIAVTTANGTACVEFIIPADGTTYNGIWAKFQYTSSCQAESKYNAPQGCYESPQCDLDITTVDVGECYYDHSDYTSKAKVKVCIQWSNRPGNENIMVSIGGEIKTVYPNSASGTACVEFIVVADGSSNNGVWAKFQYTTGCYDDAYYTAPYACYEAPPCDITVKSVNVGECYFDQADYTSKAKLTVCVQWNNRPNNENIQVSINGQTKNIVVTTASGNACVEFIILANGMQNQGIWAKFQYTTNCQAEAKYNAPQGCYETLPCDITIKSVNVDNCYYDHADYKSKAKLTVCVQWNNRPTNENIIVSINGQAQTITPNAVSGSTCIDFIILADGSSNNGVWAKFQYTSGCRADAFYNAPQSCYEAPPCDLTIKSATVGSCYYDEYDNKSKAKLTVCVQWNNRPDNENIMVSINGQTKTIIPTQASGTQCVDFTILSDGTYNNGIWAKFQYTSTCQGEYKYNAPQPCYQAPCDLDIYNVSVGNCYYDEYDGTSKAKLTVCVKWTNRPANERIYVSISGQTKVITTNLTNGSVCLEYIIAANGVYNQGIWAKYEYTTSCQDDAYYNAPQPCYQAPQCDLDIYSVSVGSCYYDSYSGTSKAKLTVCLKWNGRPSNENIYLSIDGQTKIIYPNSNSGNVCVEFVVDANGSYNNGIWAKFQYSSSCRDDAYYNAPQPCYQTPSQCNLDIYHVEIGDCYFDHADYTSKAKLKVCIQWNNAPAGEKIKLTTGNQGKLIAFSAPNGSVCVEFIVSANGVHNQGIWAKFEYTTTCQDDAYYNAPYSCSSLTSGARQSGNDLPTEAESIDLKTRTQQVPTELAQPETEGVTVAELDIAQVDTKPAATLKELRVFPNPTHDKLNVDVSAFIGKRANIQVFNTVGQIMYQTTIDEVNTNQLQLDVSQFAGELYILKVQIPNEGTFTQKFVVKK